MTSYILNLSVFETNFFLLSHSIHQFFTSISGLNYLILYSSPQASSPITYLTWFSKTVALTRSSSQNLTKRYFYTRTTTKARLVKAPVVLPKEHEDSKLSPYLISGFSDGEACFYVAVVQSKTHSQGWEVKPCFIIKLHAKDKPVLVEIKKFIGVGRITQQGPNAVQLRVFLLK